MKYTKMLLVFYLQGLEGSSEAADILLAKIHFCIFYRFCNDLLLLL